MFIFAGIRKRSSFDEMLERLEAWCQLADASALHYLKKFSRSLRKHATGICNYAKHSLKTARIEAGNVAIGMIRKRARGIQDTEYFKLKIRQTSIPDSPSMFYKSATAHYYFRRRASIPEIRGGVRKSDRSGGLGQVVNWQDRSNLPQEGRKGIHRGYFTQRGTEIIVLLAGGSKSPQAKDINTATALAAEL